MPNKIDWKEFIKKEDYRQETQSQKEFDETVDKLLESGVLSLEPNGNYQIVTGNLVLSPHHSRIWRPVLYFTQKSDAEEYAKIKFSDAMYPVDIQRIKIAKKVKT